MGQAEASCLLQLRRPALCAEPLVDTNSAGFEVDHSPISLWLRPRQREEKHPQKRVPFQHKGPSLLQGARQGGRKGGGGGVHALHAQGSL